MFTKLRISVLAVGVLLGFSQSNSLRAQDNFSITYPKENDRVQTESVLVEGKGAPPGSRLEIKVFSNQWYVQDCKANIQSNGDWDCGPVHIAGVPPSHVHIIQAQAYENGQPGPIARVRGITRR